MTSANIKQRPNGKWRARLRITRHREITHHADTRREAQEWLDGQIAARITGTWTDPKAAKVTVAVWSARWLDAQAHLKPSTTARYEGIARLHIAPTWGDAYLGDVAHADIQAWVTQLTRKGLAGSTVRYIHRVFSLMLDLAVRDNRIPRNPAAGVRLPRAAETEKRYLTHQEVSRLAEAAGDDDLVMLTFAYTGLRWGELAALRVGKVDLMRRRLTVAESVTEVRGKLTWGTPKSHHVREVPIPRFLVDRLAVHIAGKAPTDLVFTSRRGQPLRNLNFRRDVFDPAATQAGLGGLTPHELRHTAAALAVSAGANVKALQRLLGHKSAAMTLDVYAGLFEDDLDGVADRLHEAASERLADSRRTEAAVVPMYGEAAAL